MRQNPIRYMKQHDPLRKWKIGGAFAAAVAGLWGAGYMLAEDGREGKPSAPQIAEPAKSAPRPAQVWGVASEMGADGKQKATDNMWGLLMRATNEADNAQNKADQEYSAKMNKDSCKHFWRHRKSYNAFVGESDPVKRLEHFVEIGPSLFVYFADRDKQLAEGAVDLRVYYETLNAMAKTAVPAVHTQIENNPEDYLGHQKKYNQLLSVVSDPHTFRDYQDKISKLQDLKIKQAFDMLQKPVWPEFGTPESERHMEAVKEMGLVSYYHGVKNYFPGVSQEQMKSLTNRAHNYIDGYYQSWRQREEKFREEQGAPCP